MLFEKLKEYVELDIYPFHMPGHKRRSILKKDETWNSYEIDITEIDGFDNLHHAEEVLKDVQEKASKLYGAKHSFYLINGSTCGILTAISTCVKKRGHILVARNSHKSVYHGLFLNELHAIYIYPQITSFGLQGQITVEAVEQLLATNPEIQAVFITSPTYDGIVSDVRGIAEVVHRYDIPLIVDGAHGAHFGFTEDFPENPIRLGADVVIESVHKTLPAFTQTALLHVCSERIDLEKIKRYLGIYQSSSPSYLLMAGIDRCIDYMELHGKADLKQLAKNLDEFYARTKHLKHLFVLKKDMLSTKEVFNFDKSKVLIFSLQKEVSGGKLQQILLKNYGLQMEMASGQYVLALCSLMDTKEGFVRLAEALEDIDQSDIWVEEQVLTKLLHLKTISGNIYRPKVQRLPIYEAEDLKKVQVAFSEAIGKVSAEYLFLYPPGIPFLVPGEVITEDVIKDIQECQRQDLEVLGLVDGNIVIALLPFTQ